MTGRYLERYPMCESQLAQIDCRVIDCLFHSSSGQCCNVSPAITLNSDHTCVCWSFETNMKDCVAMLEDTVKKQIKFLEVYVSQHDWGKADSQHHYIAGLKEALRLIELFHCGGGGAVERNIC